MLYPEIVQFMCMCVHWGDEEIQTCYSHPTLSASDPVLAQSHQGRKSDRHSSCPVKSFFLRIRCQESISIWGRPAIKLLWLWLVLNVLSNDKTCSSVEGKVCKGRNHSWWHVEGNRDGIVIHQAPGKNPIPCVAITGGIELEFVCLIMEVRYWWILKRFLDSDTIIQAIPEGKY